MDEVYAWNEQNIIDHVHRGSFDHHFQVSDLTDVSRVKITVRVLQSF